METRRPSIRRKVRGAYHHGDLRASLKKAALRLVREKGPLGFSLNEASRLAGVSTGAPYRHFIDKDALLAEVAQDGNELMGAEIREAVSRVNGLKKKMIEAGMAYLRFAVHHSDYFAVIFQAGLEKAKYPELEHSARQAFATILDLSAQYERTPELGLERAVVAWALVHGLARLELEGGIAMAVKRQPGLEHLRPLLERFLSTPS
jgi:AcrR family transcriptional regulator